MAINNGKKFEALVRKSAEQQGIDYTRLKDSGWTGEKTTRRFTSKNICDCILFINGYLHFVEIKHRVSSLRFDEITQYDELKKKWKPDIGVYSGVICKLKDRFFYIDFESLEKMKERIPKLSFNADDAEFFGYELTTYKPTPRHSPIINLGLLDDFGVFSA